MSAERPVWLVDCPICGRPLAEHRPEQACPARPAPTRTSAADDGLEPIKARMFAKALAEHDAATQPKEPTT